MDLQSYLVNKFLSWHPKAPEVINRTKRDITLQWLQLEPFQFIKENLLFRIEKKEKIPPWVVVYSGGKTTQTIDNLAPCHPHRFRLRVILRGDAVARLADKALQFHGDENSIYEIMKGIQQNNNGNLDRGGNCAGSDEKLEKHKGNNNNKFDADGNRSTNEAETKWLQSQWSEDTCTSTDSAGASAVCFCMAVRCGYMKQVQAMLEERPELLGIVNNNGFTPLASAVRKGDVNTVRFLISAGALLDQPSSTGQTALHLAVLTANIPIVELLLEKGADFQARDKNDLRVEHYAVDSGSLNMLKLVLDRGGDLQVEDSNGWTPLFRAVCQGATTEMVQELICRGGTESVNHCDRAGLSLLAAVRMLRDRHGRRRDSILRLVDSQYPHEKALANFTKLTKKISSVHSLLSK